MVSKKRLWRAASYAVGAFVYGAGPGAERAKAATEALPTTDASHRKDDADARNDEGHHAEHSVASRLTGAVGATGGGGGTQGFVREIHEEIPEPTDHIESTITRDRHRVVESIPEPTDSVATNTGTGTHHVFEGFPGRRR
jgi:hypothetical protein